MTNIVNLKFVPEPVKDHIFKSWNCGLLLINDSAYEGVASLRNDVMVKVYWNFTGDLLWAMRDQLQW